jgi:hypothetical protein
VWLTVLVVGVRELGRRVEVAPRSTGVLDDLTELLLRVVELGAWVGVSWIDGLVNLTFRKLRRREKTRRTVKVEDARVDDDLADGEEFLGVVGQDGSEREPRGGRAVAQGEAGDRGLSRWTRWRSVDTN